MRLHTDIPMAGAGGRCRDTAVMDASRRDAEGALAPGLHDDVSTDACDDLAAVAEWLSAQIVRPPDAAMVAAARSVAGQLMLQQMGQMLGCEPEMDRLRRLMASGSADTVCVALERRHVALFEGVFAQRALPPYASCWDGTGRLCGPAVDRMRALMRQLDIRLADGVGEMPDHLGVQLALLAEAMRQRNREAVAVLMTELAWAERFGMALMNAEGQGFYGIFAQILAVFLERVRASCRWSAETCEAGA